MKPFRRKESLAVLGMLALVLLGCSSTDDKALPTTTTSTASASVPDPLSTATSDPLSTSTSVSDDSSAESPYDESPFTVVSEEGWEYEVVPSIPAGYRLELVSDVSSSPPGKTLLRIMHERPSSDLQIEGLLAGREAPDLPLYSAAAVYPIADRQAYLSIPSSSGFGCSFIAIEDVQISTDQRNTLRRLVEVGGGQYESVLNCGAAFGEIGEETGTAAFNMDEQEANGFIEKMSQRLDEQPAIVLLLQDNPNFSAGLEVYCEVTFMPDGRRFFKAGATTPQCGDDRGENAS